MGADAALVLQGVAACARGEKASQEQEMIAPVSGFDRVKFLVKSSPAAAARRMWQTCARLLASIQ